MPEPIAELPEERVVAHFDLDLHVRVTQRDGEWNVYVEDNSGCKAPAYKKLIRAIAEEANDFGNFWDAILAYVDHLAAAEERDRGPRRRFL